jgi:hypothetical protein
MRRVLTHFLILWAASVVLRAGNGLSSMGRSKTTGFLLSAAFHRIIQELRERSYLNLRQSCTMRSRSRFHALCWAG